MKKILLIIAVTMTITAPVLAHHNEQHNGPFKTIIVSIEGMVCDFCARSLEKIFYQKENVQGVIVNLDNETMTLEIDEGTDVPNEEINKLVYYAGYKTSGIKRE